MYTLSKNILPGIIESSGSKFGAVLDMVTDRSTTAGLICYLASIYPTWMLVWQLLLGLDLSSHYMHMYASLSTGSTSHKTIDRTQNWLLRAYYGKQWVLFLVCAGNEAFFLAAYMMHHGKGQLVGQVAGRALHIWDLVGLASAPVFAFKQYMNGVQLVGAAQKLAALDTAPKPHSK